MAAAETVVFFGQVAALLAVSIAAGLVAGPIFVRLLEAVARKTKNSLDNRLIESVKVPLESFFFLGVLYFLLHMFPGLEAAALVLEKYTAAIITVLAAFMLSEATGASIRWYYEEGAKGSAIKIDLDLLPLVRKVTKVSIYIVGLTLALAQAGYDVTGLVAASSVAGIIIGLASQETLANIFAGIALQIDRPYRYGDYLRLPPPSGDIAVLKKIGMRSTMLVDMNQNTIVVSNSEFAKMRVTNFSHPSDLFRMQVPAKLPLGADLRALEAKIARELKKKQPRGLDAGKGFELSVEGVEPSAVNVAFYFWAAGYGNAQAIRQEVSGIMLDFALKEGGQ